MYKIILTMSEACDPDTWMEFSRIAEYAFLHFKGDTHFLTKLAIALDRSYRDKKSKFYALYSDGAIEVHLAKEVASRNIDDLGAPQFTIKILSANG